MIVISEGVGRSRVLGIYVDDNKVTRVENDSIPQDVGVVGKISVLHFDTETSHLYYEYEDIPLTDTEKMLREENKELKQQIADLWETVLAGDNM